MKMKGNLPESLGYSKDSSKKKVFSYLVFKNQISNKLISLVVRKFKERQTHTHTKPTG